LLAGPTAVGKSEIAVLLAERLNGEIISVDSMQIYRGLDIGTAKPSPEDRTHVRHHLIDVVELTDEFDAAQFVQLAHAAVVDIQRRGRLPILGGGTGLYFKAFLEGLGEAPAADAGLRAELEATPLPGLLKELAQRDPATYGRIDRQNPRRVVRAIEVIRLTGRPFSEQRAAWAPGGETTDHGLQTAQYPFFALTRAPGELRRRIDARVDFMFRRGLVAETDQLLKQGLAENKTASHALGYRQVIEHLKGARPLAETIELVKIRTRQFAKRQMTWLRRQLRPNWIRIEAGQAASCIADVVERELTAPRLWKPPE